MLSDIHDLEVTITGVGVGLPGPDKSIFDENNVRDLLAGKNFISKIGQKKITFQKRQNVIQKRREDGKVVFKSLDEENELVRLAGEAGSFDLVEEFKVGAGLIDAWEITTQLAIAAGLEALKDAHIPIISKNGNLSLPEEMVDETGIIFASTFPSANTFLEEQRKFYNHANVLEKERIADQLKAALDPSHHQLVDDVLNIEDENYKFDRKYLLKAIPIQSGNFAQTINAKGPNTGINSACASTTQAIGIAQDWIRLGRCKRVIVVAADDPTNEETFHWIATGFLAAGAATTHDDVSQAARPFDKIRSGMILGMGAVGIVVESKDEVDKRGILPIAEVMGSYFANSAYHGTRMNPDHVKRCFKHFMAKMQAEYQIDLEEIAKSCLYMSHETFTPPKGNAAKTEIDALREVFGDSIENIIISNTKGYTAHPMGVSIEDVATIKAMEHGMIPPIANLSNPEFEKIKFSKGEDVDVNYAIRFAAGFGSQLVYLLLRNYHSTNRVTTQYQTWLDDLDQGSLELMGKTLILNPGNV